MLKSILERYILLIIVLTTGSYKANCQAIYKGNVNAIGNSISYYIDSTNALSVTQIVNRSSQFQKSTTDVPNFGLLKLPLWLKITISNTTDYPDLMLEFDQASFNIIDFYYPRNSTYIKNSSGALLPFSSRMVDYHKFLYELTIPKGRTVSYFVRIKSPQEIQLPILLGSRQQLIAKNDSNIILFGIFFGIIIVMFFYNLFIYFTVNNSIYLYYVIYILVVGLIQATIEGYGFQFLWPHSSFFAERAFFIFTALVNITGLEFVRKFLKTSHFIPRLTKVFFALYMVYGVTLILTFLGVYYLTYQILQAFAGVVSIFMLVVAIVISKKGYRPAKFFFIAWIPLIVGIIIYVLRDLNVIAYNFFTNYSITMGSSVEVILLSFALADRINILKADRERSQEEVITATRENERLIREQNVILEIKVKERTTELFETLEDLKQAQAQLVESEKMASLGQLTAGIAHEINNPINFVTSNLSPLKRDMNMIFEALQSIEDIGLSNLTIEEKQTKIYDYKEALDYDYLKEEIRMLLNGIFDGASRTAEIVKGLRIFSRLDEDDLKMADINEGLESSMIILNNLVTDKIEVIKQYGNLPLIECYPGKLNQVFLNILSNAIYATTKRHGDTKDGRIVLDTSSSGGYVFIKITDNGIGMNDETQKKIFDPFFTTKDVGEGTGLGLSITYNTIKKHNGEIKVSSSLGVGTEFIIKLPVVSELAIVAEVNHD